LPNTLIKQFVQGLQFQLVYTHTHIYTQADQTEIQIYNKFLGLFQCINS